MNIYLNQVENFFRDFITNKRSSHFYNFLAIMGFYYLGCKLINSLYSFKKYFFTTESNLKHKYGDDWVIITGATDGIGKSFAKEFVKRGHKILMIARNESKAIEVVNELTKIKSDARVEYIIYDLDKFYTDEDIKELEEKLASYKEVSILVNNAGVGKMKSLVDSSNKEIRSLINVNMNSVTFLTKAIIPKMNKNKRALIVFSGSGLYKIKPAYSTVYSGTKCYLDGFMSCLSQEHDNIDFTYLEIGSVSTNLNKSTVRSKISPDDYCSSAIKHIGKYEYSAGHPKHGLLMGVALSNNFFLQSTRKFIKKGVEKMQNNNNNINQ
jgi:17beta-estradiol 17-dehydrogenase / very-long-chain 3-oxoacyl-CoA reductase